VITGKFRRSKLCTRIEGERLLSFTNTADPLFIFGAVAVGMFGYPRLGMVLAMAHYLSSFTVGVIFKYYGKHDQEKALPPVVSVEGGLLRRAVQALLVARREDGRPLGKLMGDAVRESMSTLLMIGGFIMLFAVLVKILTLFGVFSLLNPFLGGTLKLFGIDPHLTAAVFNGLIEIDLGTVAASKAAAPLIDKVVIAGWIIAWSGLSVHGQVASVIHDTDIRMMPYMVARLLHAIFAAWYTWLLFGSLIPVFAPVLKTIPTNHSFNPWERMIFSGQQLLMIFGILLLLSLAIYFSKRFAVVFKKAK